MADGTIKIPGVGPVKTVYVVAGVSVLGGILVYAYWKRSQAPSDALTEGTPATSYDTGSGFVEDSLASGYNTVYPSVYPATSQYGYDLYGNPLPPPTGAGSGGPYTTNNDWATAAEDALESGGVTLEKSTLAISRVLGGLSVTSDQRDLFMQAVGVLGQPPQGYPTPIKLVDNGTEPPTATVPNNIPTDHFIKIGSTTTWDNVARAYNVFGGNGQALYEYNLLPGKHQPQSYAAVRNSWPTIHAHPSWEVDLPKKGLKVNLPVVGTVTS